jgi:catechol 2,3-dioxygenase-like lactoylglutathione lyase family enzyme
MPVMRMNHAVLYVRDVAATREFYENALGFETLVWMPGQAAFFLAPGSTNDHDLGTFQIGSAAGPSAAGRSTVGLYHLAWEVDTLGELERLAGVLKARGALVGQSDHVTTKSLYAHDPDGLEFEVCWLLPLSAIDERVLEEHKGGMTKPLDLAKEIARFGRDLRGGVGISVPA